MLNDQVIDVLSERLVRRTTNLNTYIIKKIGENIKKIGKLTPTEARQLENILKYGGSFEEITKEIAKVTKLNVKDIYEIYEKMAIQDQQFAKQFYKYRNIDFIPYKKNIALQRQVKALAKITADTFFNFSNTEALGYGFIDEKTKKIRYKGLKQAYNDIIDEAILSISQGKETFDQRMSKIINDIGESGLKVIYENGYARRLDSTVRMNIEDGLAELHNTNMELFGNEFGYDGIEISTHAFPAIDHEKAQGHQFSIIKPSENELSEWEKLQNGEEAKDYKGNIYTLDHDDKNGFRPISTMNCKHYIFTIVLGASKPAYSEKELQQIINNNNEGFELDGKHYTLYEGTQLQRKLELELRKAKDKQIMARSSGINEETIEDITNAQQRITMLTHKYNQVLKASNLPSLLSRAKVSGYRRISASNLQKQINNI